MNTATRTSLMGGSGILLGTAYPLLLALPDLLPLPREAVLTGSPVLYLISCAVFAVAFGVLAFGVGPNLGFVGTSRLGQGALLIFGFYAFVLRIAALLSIDLGGAAAMTDGAVSLALTVVGLTAGWIAATVIVRARQVQGFARWALFPIVSAQTANVALALVPVQSVAALSPLTNALGLLLTVAAGVAFAVHGRGRSIRDRLRVIERRW